MPQVARPQARGLQWRLPVLLSLQGYKRSWVRRDLVAGTLIVAIAIPISMGMAEVAGMPPVAGLYSCVLPLVGYALFGSSRQLVISLDASTAAMLAAAVAPLAGGDPLRYAALAGGLTLVAGLMLAVAGLARLGLVAEFLSEPVLLGYQAGLAFVVIASQLPRMLGLKVAAESTLGQFYETAGRLAEAHPLSVGIGAFCLVVVLLLRWWRPAIPGSLVVLVVASVAVWALDLAEQGVVVVGAIPSGLPRVSIPDVTLGDLWDLLPAGAAIALVAAGDTLASSRAFAIRGGYRVDASRDLVGLGAANVLSAVSGGITTSASASRTAVAESVGSRSQVAGVTAAALMAVVLVFMTGWLGDVPVAALAAIVFAAVLRIIDVRAMRTLLRVRSTEFAIAMAAIAGVVGLGVLEGVVIAMGLSLLDFVWRTSRPGDAVLGVSHERGGYHDVARVEDAAAIPGVLIYRFHAPLFYANAERFRRRLRVLVRDREGTRLVIVDASSIPDLDVTAGRMLGELREELSGEGVRLVIAGAVGKVYDMLVSDDLKEDFTEDDMYETIDQAAASAGRPAAGAESTAGWD